jgi:hypothetical protein
VLQLLHLTQVELFKCLDNQGNLPPESRDGCSLFDYGSLVSIDGVLNVRPFLGCYHSLPKLRHRERNRSPSSAVGLKQVYHQRSARPRSAVVQMETEYLKPVSIDVTSC